MIQIEGGKGGGCIVTGCIVTGCIVTGCIVASYMVDVWFRYLMYLKELPASFL